MKIRKLKIPCSSEITCQHFDEITYTLFTEENIFASRNNPQLDMFFCQIEKLIEIGKTFISYNYRNRGYRTYIRILFILYLSPFENVVSI